MEFTRTVKYMTVTATLANKNTKEIEQTDFIIDHEIKDEEKLEKAVKSIVPSGFAFVSIDKVEHYREIRSIPYDVFIRNSKVITR